MSADEPRFGLRYEAGRAVLRLAAPLRAGGAVFDALELLLPGVRSPLDLRGGVGRFRTHRTRLHRGCLRIAPATLAELAARAGVELSLRLPDSDGRMQGAIRDAGGWVAFRLACIGDGADLLLLVDQVRSVSDAGQPPLTRFLNAAETLGLELDGAAGGLRMRFPLRAALREALVVRGWRLPDGRVAPVSAPLLGDRDFVLEIGRRDGDLAIGEEFVAHREQLRVAAPALVELRQGRIADAISEIARIRRRAGDVGPLCEGLRALEAELAFDSEADGNGSSAAYLPLESQPDAARCALGLRAALRVGTASELRAWAEALLRVEPLRELVVSAACQAADRLREQGHEAWAFALLTDAMGRAPRSSELLTRWLGLSQHVPDGRLIERVASWLVLSPGQVTGPARGRLAASAAAALEALGCPAEADRFWEEARAVAPDDAGVLSSQAACCQERGDVEGTLRLLDRIAEAHRRRGESPSVAAIQRQAAQLLDQAGKGDLAELRLLGALDLCPDPETICLLAAIRRRRGALVEAAAAYDELLLLSGADVAEALFEAADFHLAEGHARAAHPFLEALERADGKSSRFAELRRALEQAPGPADA